MKIEFEKWHGAKNDFVTIWINQRDDLLRDSLIRQAAAICTRDGSGISADGILVLEEESSETITPNKLTIINSDGSIAETCGNGIRCAASSILRRARDQVKLDTVEGGFDLPIENSVVTCRFLGDGNLAKESHYPLVSVSMGIPKINEQNVAWREIQSEVKAVSKELNLPELLNDYAFISINNQHLVFFLEDMDTDLLHQVGKRFQSSSLWDGINVHLVNELTQEDVNHGSATKKLGQEIGNYYRALIWERGVGPTQACGSGACAIAKAAINSGFVDRSKWIGIVMPGDTLFTKQAADDDSIELAGPVEHVFDGSLSV
ncbi:MAG: hypothetical protein HRU19_11735 [Pseudobacteriovorax sp.]|nr:hypothetical protein [Pseudobacteriovorax sp.]